MEKEKREELHELAWGGNPSHTTHALARLLLELPDLPLVAYTDGGLCSRSDPLFGNESDNVFVMVETTRWWR